jgi:hypothetical protein
MRWKREQDGCGHGPIGLTARRTAAALRYTAGPMDVDVYLERGTWLDATTGRPRPVAEQWDGPPCANPDCPYRYQLGTPHRTAESALRAGAAHALPGVSIARTFVKLSLVDALAADATDIEQLDDRRLAANDPVAHELLRALGDEGYDVAWIRSATGGNLMLVFTRSFGHEVQIASERSRLYDGERWQDDGFDPREHGRTLMVAFDPRPAGREAALTRCRGLVTALTGQGRRPLTDRL